MKIKQQEIMIDASDVVINLVGKYYETRTMNSNHNFPYFSFDTNYDFEEAHCTIPKMIAEVSAELGVKDFIHVSAVGASKDNQSSWMRSKANGEEAVRTAFPNATVIRSSQLFGPEDRLLNWFANVAKTSPFVPMIDGDGAITKPVYMGDVAQAIVRIVQNPRQFGGKTFELEGGRDFTYKELAEFVYDVTGQTTSMVDVPKEVVGLVSKVTGLQPFPTLTSDQVELWSQDFVSKPQAEGSEEILGFDVLGMETTKIERVAFSYLHRFRTGGHFAMTEGWHTGASLK